VTLAFTESLDGSWISFGSQMVVVNPEGSTNDCSEEDDRRRT
jgi:hypothetical protein